MGCRFLLFHLCAFPGQSACFSYGLPTGSLAKWFRSLSREFELLAEQRIVNSMSDDLSY